MTTADPLARLKALREYIAHEFERSLTAEQRALRQQLTNIDHSLAGLKIRRGARPRDSSRTGRPYTNLQPQINTLLVQRGDKGVSVREAAKWVQKRVPDALVNERSVAACFNRLARSGITENIGKPKHAIFRLKAGKTISRSDT